MAERVVRSWDEVWAIGRNAEMTHWNYSRGKQRFRGILEEPEDIGEEAFFTDEDYIRIRFFKLVGEEYVENETLDTWLKVAKSNLSEFPDDFDAWEYGKQQTFVQTTMHKISTIRFSKQMDSADRMLYKFLDFLTSLLAQRDKLIKELMDKNQELQNTKGIGNMWEFLVHPNAKEVIAAITGALNSRRTSGLDLVDELRRLNATGQLPPGLLDQKPSR